jgi:uncharacterized protein YkwD
VTVPAWFVRLFDRLAGVPRFPPVPPPPNVRPTPPLPLPPGPGPTPSAEASEFLVLVNAARAAQSGRDGIPRPPLAWDKADADDAARNDAIQARRGLGHYTFAGNATVYREQVAAEGSTTAAGVLAQWKGSPDHWADLMDPAMRKIGLHHQAPYWTGDLS